jgi:rhodanese-related sulfurtransferase
VHDVVADARRRFERVSALELRALLDEGAATVVDIRIPEDRVRHGVIDPSVSVPRTVLEWRVDPASGYSNPVFESFDQRLVVVCNEGYSSSLAAAALVDLGFGRATDLIGGMVAWLDAGLAVAPSPLDEEAYLGPPER